MWTEKFWTLKLGLEKAEEPGIKLPTMKLKDASSLGEQLQLT